MSPFRLIRALHRELQFDGEDLHKILDLRLPEDKQERQAEESIRFIRSSRSAIRRQRSL